MIKGLLKIALVRPVVQCMSPGKAKRVAELCPICINRKQICLLRLVPTLIMGAQYAAALSIEDVWSDVARL